MQEHGINHYSSFSPLKASVIERFNRTLKGRMYKAFSLQGSYKWIHILPKLMRDYNNSFHRTIKAKPVDVTKETEDDIRKAAYDYIIPYTKPKFKVNEHVRISRYKGVFEKSFTPNWSTEIFTISHVNLTNPRTYRLKDVDSRPILGDFYELELQKVKYPDVYLVERIIRRQKNKVFIKWLGFSHDHNSWVDKKDLLDK